MANFTGSAFFGFGIFVGEEGDGQKLKFNFQALYEFRVEGHKQ